MSTVWRAYIGPYIVCKTTILDTTETTFCCKSRGCAAEGARVVPPIDGTPMFCVRCGRRLEFVEKPVHRPAIEQRQVLGELSELRWPQGGYDHNGAEHIYLGDDEDDGLGETIGSHDFVDFSVTEFAADRISDEIATFRDFYHDALHMLGGFYGDENVSVRWGIVRDCN